MKNFETEITLSGKNHRVFLQPGFFATSSGRITPHIHKCAELHCVFEGEADYLVDSRRYRIRAGEVLLIPGSAYHSYSAVGEGITRCCFQISDLEGSLRVVRLPQGLAESVMGELRRYEPEGDFTLMSCYLTLIMSIVADTEPKMLSPLTDREFLINEFFANNYDRDVDLDALSHHLNLSPKQTQRMVIKHTGRPFREELSYRRIRAAAELMREGRMTYAEVAERVGYQTYSGFWRAYTKYARAGAVLPSDRIAAEHGQK